VAVVAILGAAYFFGIKERVDGYSYFNQTII
jgi:hypothetical protein